MPIIKKESKLAEEEKREPELMPPISSHTLRHTGCTRLGENNVNPKVMQYVMGHSDAQITMNVYNHIAEKSHVEPVKSRLHKIFTKPSQKISTHLLTVLIIGVILQLEQEGRA